MNLSDVRKLVEQGESLSLEFKKSTAQLKEATQTLCAFLNNNGGKVIIGVDPKDNIIGQEISDKTKRTVYEVISKIEPATDIDIEYIEVSLNKYVIVLTANPEKKHQPYAFDSMPYQRIESSTRKMPQRIQEQMYLKRSGYFDHWDSFSSPIQNIRQLDVEAIKEAAFRAKLKTSDMLFDDSETIKKILKKFRLIDQDDQMMNAALVLFGDDLQIEYPQCTIKMAVFKGRDKSSDFVDKKRYCVNVFRALDLADRFFNMYIPKSGTFVKGDFYRKDTPIIPYEAYREALLNALCHRNYFNRSGSISMAFYTDRLEISNIGGLVPDLSLEDLEHDHQSYPRNKVIAQVFDTCGLIESWGKGTTDMIQNCENAGLPKPEFKVQSSAFYVTFKFDEKIQEERIVREIATISGQETLKGNHQIILKMIQSAGGEMAISELLEKLDISKRTLQRNLQELKELGLLKQIGKSQKAKWILLK